MATIRNKTASTNTSQHSVIWFFAIYILSLTGFAASVYLLRYMFAWFF